VPAYRKLTSGKWRAQVRLPNGKRPSKADPLKSVVKRWAEDLEASVRRGDWVDPSAGKVTVAAFRDQWWPWPGRKGQALSAHTLRNYEQQWRLRVEPYWGRWQLSAIQRADVAEWCDRMNRSTRVGQPGRKSRVIDVSKLAAHEEDGWEELGRATRVNEIARTMLASLLRVAAEKGAVRANPAAGVYPAKPLVSPPRWFTKEEAARILAALPSDTDRLMVGFNLRVGLRWGELAALRGLRIDQLRKVVVVQDVLMYDGALRHYPKEHHSQREVPIPPDLVAAVLGRVGEDLTGWLFPAPNGGPLLYANWYSRVWVPALAAAGVDGTPHHMRHTAASWLVQDGVDLGRVQRLLGHASYTTTQRYAHLAPDYHGAITDSWRRDSQMTHEDDGGVADEGAQGS
jgi:integrase